MKRAKIPYAFKPLPEELPLIWQDLDFYPRLIIQELWRMSDNGLLNTRLKYLVRDMRIAKKGDRGNAQTAVNTLVRERLLKEGSDGVRIALGMRWECVGPTEVGTSAIPTQAKYAKPLSAPNSEEREEKRREEIAPGSGPKGESARSRPSPARRGFEWFAALVGKLPTQLTDYDQRRASYELIGLEPAEGLAKRRETILADGWIAANLKTINVNTLAQDWNGRWLHGPYVPVSKPLAKAESTPTAHQLRTRVRKVENPHYPGGAMISWEEREVMLVDDPERPGARCTWRERQTKLRAAKEAAEAAQGWAVASA